jgi:hypothetical protein
LQFLEEEITPSPRPKEEEEEREARHAKEPAAALHGIAMIND